MRLSKYKPKKRLRKKRPDLAIAWAFQRKRRASWTWGSNRRWWTSHIEGGHYDIAIYDDPVSTVDRGTPGGDYTAIVTALHDNLGSCRILDVERYPE